jgi:hypothetical protein
MKKTGVFFMALFIFSSSFQAQEIKKSTKKAPQSIYTYGSFNTDTTNFFSLNERLNLASYNFVIVSQIDIDLNRASLNLKDIGKKASKFIYDDYTRYQNNNLLKGFLLENDPTRWNLHCIENRIQPYFLK